MNEIFERLKAPFPLSTVKWRQGQREGTKVQMLPYIDSRDVQARLDEVMGPDKWSSSMKPTSVGVVGGISILCDGTWVTKEDGAQFDNFNARDNNSNSKELAIKGGFSDAFKRAAVMWGIGRYLYAYKAPLADVDEHGKEQFTPWLPPELLPEAEREAATANAPDKAPEVPAVPEKAEAVPSTGTADAAAKTADDKATVSQTASASVGTAATSTSTQPEPAAAKTTASEPASDDGAPDSGVNYGALADAAASSSQPEPAKPDASASKKSESAPAGSKAVQGHDYSHLTLSDDEEKYLADFLRKLGKVKDSMLLAFLGGVQPKAKLPEAALAWLVTVVQGRIEADSQKAA